MMGNGQLPLPLCCRGEEDGRDDWEPGDLRSARWSGRCVRSVTGEAGPEPVSIAMK